MKVRQSYGEWFAEAEGDPAFVADVMQWFSGVILADAKHMAERERIAAIRAQQERETRHAQAIAGVGATVRRVLKDFERELRTETGRT